MANETKTEKKAEKELKKLQEQKAKKEKKAAKALEAREKRKASIEKSNETQAAKEKKRRNMTKGQRARRILLPLLAVLVAVAIALCGFFGVFDRAVAAHFGEPRFHLSGLNALDNYLHIGVPEHMNKIGKQL